MTLSVDYAISKIESHQTSIEERIFYGNYLGKIGDPRFDTFNPVMISVHGGTYPIGSNELEIDASYLEFAHLFTSFTIEETKEWFYKEHPKHTMIIKPFRVAKYLITNLDFKKFKQSDRKFKKNHFEFPLEKSNHPVTGINIAEARLYCDWLSNITKRNFRLLREAEWEWLAGSGNSYRFPWGNTFEIGRANTAEIGIGATTPVGIFLEGNSKQGITDLAGNVEEWVDNLYEPYPGGRIIKDRIYFFNNGNYNVLRGGCYNLHGDLCISTRRHGYFPEYSITGFRIAESI